MDIQLIQEDIKDIEEVRELHFQFEMKKGKERCETILEQKSFLYQVRTYYAFFLIYDNVSESLRQMILVYEQAPFYFENTSYLLDNILSSFQNKGRDLVQRIEKQYLEYLGEKNGFYFICLALIYRINGQNNKCCETLISRVDDYKNQPYVQAWYFHQLGCYFQSKTIIGDDETNENVQNSLKYFRKGLEIQPRSTMNLQNIGVQYNRFGSEEGNIKAIEYFKKSLEINPTDHYALANLSNVYLEQQEYDKCFNILQLCFDDLKFNFVLYQFSSLIISQIDDLNIEDLNKTFLTICQGIKKIIMIEANNLTIFSCFQNLQILSIQNYLQFDYIDEFAEIISLFRSQDILSLNGLMQNQLRYEDEDEQIVQFPIQTISLVLIKKEQTITEQILELIVYSKQILPSIEFQSHYSHWDLLIDQ